MAWWFLLPNHTNLKIDHFNTLLSFFPEIDLPVTLSDDTLSQFNNHNEPIPSGLIAETIGRWESIDEDFSEIIPCLSIDISNKAKAIVYWKGDLMRYDFKIATFNNHNELIAVKSIASTIIEGSHIKKSVALIDEDFIIHIMAGDHDGAEEYDAGRSQSFNMEVMADGQILFEQ